MTANTLISRRLWFAAIAFCLLPAFPLHAQIDQWGYWQNGVSEPWWFSTAEFTSEEAAKAVVRWNEIGAEKKNSSHEWAGDYFRGSDVHGTFVRWSPEAGFVIADIDKCQAKVMRVTYGRVNATVTLIEFIPEFRKGSQHHQTMHSETELLSTIRFVPVRWRGILHLVSPDEISDFGNLAAGLGNYNMGFNPAGWLAYDFYYKLNGEESAAAGDLPVVPAGYEQFVKKPIEATIESVGSRRVKRVPTVGGPPYYESHSTVVINAGGANGVKRRMIFRVRDSEGDDTVEIIRVRRTSSFGRIVRTLDDYSSETYYDWDTKTGKQFPKRYPPIAVGWRVTTAPK
jgi:hypothetical protein